MPIKFLTGRHRAQRLGRVRLGIKQISERTGKSHPVATPYFVLKDAAALIEFYDAEPTQLRIEFLSDNLDFTFPHFLRRYVKSGLRCLGDGEMIMYRVNDAGDKDVSDGHALDPDGKAKMDDRAVWIRVTCPGDQCPHYISGACKPTGFLRFVPTEAPRLGYYDMVCHQRAIVGIKTQLELAKSLFGHITGIPFILHRGDPEKVPVKVPGKGMVNMPVRTQWIEIDPQWFAENFAQRDEHLALSTRTFRQDVIELFGEDGNGGGLPDGLPDGGGDSQGPLAPSAGNGDFGEPLFEGEEEPSAMLVDEATGEIVDVTLEEMALVIPDAPGQPAVINSITRPADPETVRGWLTSKAAGKKRNGPPSPNQRGLMNGLLSKILGGDKERRSWISYAWGMTSSKDMTGAQVAATLDWLRAERAGDGTGEYIPDPHAVEEARRMLRQAMVDTGQSDMFEP